MEQLREAIIWSWGLTQSKCQYLSRLITSVFFFIPILVQLPILYLAPCRSFSGVEVFCVDCAFKSSTRVGVSWKLI